MQNFQKYFEQSLTNGLPLSDRQQLEVSIVPAGTDCSPLDARTLATQRRFVATALNDAVISAGPPFRMIELTIAQFRTELRWLTNLSRDLRHRAPARHPSYAS